MNADETADKDLPIPSATALDHPASNFIQALPKAELHLHLEGSIEPATLGQLIERHGGGPIDWPRMARLYNHRTFTDFLMAFRAITHWLRDPDDYEIITYNLIRRLASENVVHAEVYVSVGVMLWRNQPFAEIFDALERGRKRGERDFGVSVNWIFDAVRHFGAEAGERVVDEAIRYRDRNVVAVGIGGDERIGPAEWFVDAYRRAADHGLRLTAHAGESSGPESIIAALDQLHAERIGHGLTAIQDPALLQRLAEQQVAVEICISSNVRTGCCAKLEKHPVRRYFDAGLNIVLNTDDPAMFQTTLSREYQIAQDCFGFSDEELGQLARNSFRASFLPEQGKRELLTRF